VSRPEYANVPLPVFDPALSPESLFESLEEWVFSPALRDLVEMFGGAGIIGGNRLSVVLEALDAFSGRWDFRGGKERNLARTKEFAGEHEEVVLAAARALGLVDSPAPGRGPYDHMIVLGGLLRACMLRPRLAAQLRPLLAAQGTVTGIGAFRPLGGDEVPMVGVLGLDGVDDEISAMDAGMRLAFGLGAPSSVSAFYDPENRNLSWSRTRYGLEGGATIEVVAAPSNDPGRRANTPDSYQFWAEDVAKVDPGDHILLVTSAIYVPFQHADAIRMLGLPYGASVDTVGVDASLEREPILEQTFTASNYLQEVRSTIRSMRLLAAAVRDEVPGGT